MTSLQKAFNDHWKGKEAVPDEVFKSAKKQSFRYKGLKAAGKSEKEINVIFSKPIEMTLFGWEEEWHTKMSPDDSIRYTMSLLHTGLLAMQPHDGAIKAWVGGDNYKYFQYDHVRAKRQVGSTFKPIVVAAALNEGMEPDAYFSNEQNEEEKVVDIYKREME